MHVKLSVALILFSLLLPASTYAQVFNLGPSASNLFNTVINIPPDTAVTSAGISTQVNLYENGSLVGDFHANAGSEINVSGGTIGPHPTRLYANSGSEVNISGGRITNLNANSGSVVNFLGGGDSNSQITASSGSVLNVFGSFDFRGLILEADSELNFFGRDFSLNGVPLDGLTTGVPFEITDRGEYVLESLLLDGEVFMQPLRFVPSTATVTVTLVPEPSTIFCTLTLIMTCQTKRNHRRIYP